MAFLALAPALVACGSRGPSPWARDAAAAGPVVAGALEATRQCPPAVAVEGIDVFDGQGTIDWVSVRASGVAFAFIKATQGTYDTQATFADNWRASAAAGVLRGAYHFFDPTEDGAAQAAYFLSVVSVASPPGDLPAVLDVECPDGDDDCLGTGSAGVASAGDIRARMLAFLGAVSRALGRTPIVYTFSSYFADEGIDTTGLDAYPLYLAWIPAASGGASGGAGAPCLDVPVPWSSAEFWQYSFEGSVAGIAGAVDRDRFLGALSALRALADAGPRAAAGCP
jgi:lysozyme